MDAAGDWPCGNGQDRAPVLPILLDSLLRRRLIRWCRETATQLDVVAVPQDDIIECLVELLMQDVHLDRAVRLRLKAAMTPLSAEPKTGADS